MIYETGEMRLEVVGEIFRGSVNDVLVCKDINSAAQTVYTLISVHDSESVKKILRIFSNDPRTANEPPYLLRFAHNEEMCFLFPYRAQRKLTSFAAGQTDSVYRREKIAISLVMECLSTSFPFPFLYLILKQKNIHLNQDDSVYFTPELDLAELDENKNESTCVSRCAGILLAILAPHSKGRKPSTGYELIRKKRLKKGYSGFSELYHDVRLTATEAKKPSLSARLKAFWSRNKDFIFRLLLFICGILMTAAAILLISQLLFGDVPLLRLFGNSFKEIGTENLVKR